MLIHVVTYSANSLNIILPSSCPEALHRLLICGMITAMKNAITTPHTSNEIEGLKAMADVLSQLIPAEDELARGKTAA